MNEMNHTIYYTKDYSIFSTHPANREGIARHIKKLKESFKSPCAAYLRPIIVNNEMQIIDGQQRFLTWKELDIGVYYGILPDDVDDVGLMIKLNNNQRSWKLKDYLKVYCKENKEDYLLLDRFITQTNISLNTALIILNRHGASDDLEAFREGRFKFPHETAMYEVFDILNTFTEIDNILKSHNPYLSSCKVIRKVAYIRGLLYLISQKKFPRLKFIKQFKRNIKEFHPCMNHESYTRMFKEMYNKGLRAVDQIH
jgi:hypothetical protein